MPDKFDPDERFTLDEEPEDVIRKILDPKAKPEEEEEDPA